MSSGSFRVRLAGTVGIAACAVTATVFCLPARPAQVQASKWQPLADGYAKDIRPLVQQYCRRCHCEKRTEADVNFEAIATWTDVRKNLKTWQKAAEMLDGGQMPPRGARQPTFAERARLQQWVRSYLLAEARELAGDPGPVVLRRLSNAEYTYTLRDLTGVASLQPAREFPVDGAAGEGFTNTGNALVMSPALLTKYFDAAKEVANHAVLLPDGFRFSAGTTRRDFTNEILGQIRDFYRPFSDAGGGERVNLQGIVFDTNQGGRLPVERYLAATLEERDALLAKRKTIESLARERGLNARYLGTLWQNLTSREPSLLLDGLRAHWRSAGPGDVAALAADVAAWQKGLWRFGTVGHIGKVGGPKRWLEPVDPLVSRQEFRLPIAAAPGAKEVTLSLMAGDAGDGNEHDYVIWHRPRLVAPGRPDLLLRDVRAVSRDLTARRERVFADTPKYLAAAAEAATTPGKTDPAALARKHGVEADALRAWLDYLGIGAGGSVKIDGYLTGKMTSSSGYDFIQGWGSPNTPLLVANSSGRHVRIPGNMKPHGVAVHPSPTLQAVVGWRSAVTTTLRIEGHVVHAHPECGNGITWALEWRRGAVRRRLGAGIVQGSKDAVIHIERLAVVPGDLVSLLIGPRDGNHACDLTAVDLKLTSGDGKTWDLAGDVSGNVLAGNPHADRLGHPRVWHFYTEPDRGGPPGPVVPAGSLLAQWLEAQDAPTKQKLAGRVQQLLTAGPLASGKGPDAELYQQLSALGGPLFRGLWNRPSGDTARTTAGAADWGPDPARFGKHPTGGTIDAASLCVRAPSVIEVRLPADLVAGCKLVTTGTLDPKAGAEGSVQLRVVPGRAASASGLLPSGVAVTVAGGQWTSDNRRTAYQTPILVNEGSAKRKQIEAAFDDFRRLFPAALCYTKIVPVDEVVTLTLFYREDDHLVRLMLDDAQKARIDRLWDELHYVSRDALTEVDALAQIIEYATQDADPKVFEPLRKPFQERAARFRQWLLDTQPRHLDALVDFAARAYRRPLTDQEKQELRQLYHKLRDEKVPHEEAFRLTLARVLVAPAFLYRLEQPGSGKEPRPVSDWELASRLSYFLWSSQPDDELRALAAAGRLHEPDVLVAQARRMLRDPRVRRLATEFACQWLHIYDFDQLDEKSERHFPTFAGLRGAMYEESIRFFTDLFQRDRPVLDILDGDYTYLNEALAKHYGIPGVTGPQWRRVEGVKKYARGGILAQATTLAKQSGASRTSPILRGNWVSEVLLGERLPKPPPDVPRLPEDETATAGLTVRQLVEKHSTDPRCAVCHRRIDAFGFALEGFDSIGRRRDKDLAGRPIDTHAQTLDGARFEGLDGLRNYLLNQRRPAFMRQFCRKFLGYALGRAIQLSDEPLLADMEEQLKAHDYRFTAALDAVVRSPQFRMIRGRLLVSDNEPQPGREP